MLYHICDSEVIFMGKKSMLDGTLDIRHGQVFTTYASNFRFYDKLKLRTIILMQYMRRFDISLYYYYSKHFHP